MIFAKLPYRAVAFALAGFFTLSNILTAGFIYQMEQKDQPGATTVMQLWVDSGNLKIGNLNDQEGEMVYNSATKTMTMIDHSSRSYVQLDQAAIKKLSAQMKQAMAEYERALQSVPAAQRQMMEQMLQQQMPGLAAKDAPKIEVNKTANSAEIGKYKTTVYEVKTDGKKTQELFVTDWGNLQGSDDVMSILQEMSGFMNEMMQALATGPMANMMPASAATSWLDPLREVNGFPVAVKEFDNSGKLSSETKLLSIEEATIAPSTFQPPSGYRRQSLDF